MELAYTKGPVTSTSASHQSQMNSEINKAKICECRVRLGDVNVDREKDYEDGAKGACRDQ